MGSNSCPSEEENSERQKDKEIKDYKLLPDEQEVVCYVVGHIVFSLRRKYFYLIKSEVPLTRQNPVAITQFLEKNGYKFLP